MPPDAIVLAFDTSAAHCAAALLFGHVEPGLQNTLRIRSRVEMMEKGQAEHLVPMTVDLLTAHGVDWRDITRLAVGVGPGNFTGIRIAVSLVRGLALGLGVPAVGVTGFEAVAWAGGRVLPCWTLIDAPRGQVYAQRFPGGTPHILDAKPDLDAPVLRQSDLDAAQLVSAIAEVGFMKPLKTAPRPAPFYLRAADAAPPSDPPPVILP